MGVYVIGFQDIDQESSEHVGGKGNHLGKLANIEDIHVPDGFCISTKAYTQVMEQSSSLQALLDQLSHLEINDRQTISELSAEIRKVIEGMTISEDISHEIISHVSRLGEDGAYAIRSSATAEDLPTASFAGQHDTFLNVTGTKSILQHISKCWASLFTDRAVSYRFHHGIDHRKVQIAVIVQKMISPQAAGIMFSADPVTSNRSVISIDASFGLGEALVSGLVNADQYQVRHGKIIGKTIGTKQLAIYSSDDGGTQTHELPPEQQNKQVLTDEQISHLAGIGRKIEKHFGHPQDIEWCLNDGVFHIVQSRPITTLYPIPAENDQDYHVYVSVGHQQMMTDAMKPLGWSFYLLTTPAPMRQAGGRLFVDVTPQLMSSVSREAVLNTLGQSDPLIKDALKTIIERGDFIKISPHNSETPVSSESQSNQHSSVKHLSENQSNQNRTALPPRMEIDFHPTIMTDLMQQWETAIETLQQNISSKYGTELFDFISEDILRLRALLFDPQSLGVIMAAMNAAKWINEHMNKWLGEKNVADTLSQSVPHNVTSEMGLALLDVADVIRPYPEIIHYLEHTTDDHFMNRLDEYEGGQEVGEAIHAFLEKYGMRCVGEIDLTRPRWREKPATLIPMILNHIKHFAPHASTLKYEQGRLAAMQKEQELLERLDQLPDGEQKVNQTKHMIDIIRNYSGYREFPKYGMVRHYFIYKQALLREAETLVKAGIIHGPEDIYYLTFAELHELVRQCTADISDEMADQQKILATRQIINTRRDEHNLFKKLTPPRVFTSEGEIIAGQYRRENLPANAIVGLPVSTGIAEGRARVIFNIEEADLKPGDILVTPFTDPSWTPLFVTIKGLITEVGGLMTHGAVIAREYGLPAVVGVEHATSLIQDGQRIRLNGTEGYVELL